MSLYAQATKKKFINVILYIILAFSEGRLTKVGVFQATGDCDAKVTFLTYDFQGLPTHGLCVTAIPTHKFHYFTLVKVEEQLSYSTQLKYCDYGLSDRLSSHAGLSPSLGSSSNLASEGFSSISTPMIYIGDILTVELLR